MKLKKGKLLGAILLTVFLSSSCRSLKNSNTLFQSEYDKFGDSSKAIYVANENARINAISSKIRPYDLIAVKNLQNPEGLTATATAEGVQTAAIFKINKEGSTNFPVVGLVSLDGLTPSEASLKLQELYGKALLKNPIIDVSIISSKVILLGETPKPGTYALDREHIDLVELLGKNGGLLPSSDPKKVKIIRGDRKNPEIIYVNLRDIKSLASDKLMLQNNDIVYIPKRKLYHTTEGVKDYVAVIQPVILLINALILVTTFNRL